MENKISSREYIRTYDGIIGKILEDEDIGENGVYIDTTFLDDYADETNFVKYEDIKKHSFNIIDLIEERDYVNGIKIYSLKKGIGYGDKEQEVVIINKNFCNCKFIRTEDIKSIVTKEQFERMKYEV